MLFPAVNDLTNENMNRYGLVIAVAKCARKLTDMENSERENADAYVVKEFSDKYSSRKENKEEKAVIEAINKIYDGEYSVRIPGIK